MDAARYQGKPFLRLLECYVLWAVGQLDPQQAEALERMTPKLREVYGTEGRWQDIVAAQMAFPDSLPEELRSLWARNQQIARDNGTVLEPEQFARMVADRNFT
jgi:ribonuclease D